MASRPDLILLQTDQHLWNALGVSGGVVQTPHLDPDEWHNRYEDPAVHGRREAMTRNLLLHVMQAFARFPQAFSRIPLRAAVEEEAS